MSAVTMVPENPPFSRILLASDVPANGLLAEAEADQIERLAVAEMLGAQSVEQFRYRFRVRPVGRDGFEVKGTITAHLVQASVVTLEPIKAEINQEVSVRFAPVDTLHADDDELIDPDSPDVEPLADEQLDLGQLAYEHLAIGVDPYPRNAEDEFEWGSTGEEIDPADDSPFAALKRLKET